MLFSFKLSISVSTLGLPVLSTTLFLPINQEIL
jgi:hypothetical protein